MIESLIDLAIELNKDSRNWAINKGLNKTTHPISWMKEFCTIHIDIGRASGKTKYISEHATINDIIFVSNGGNARMIRDYNDKANIVVVHFDGLQNFMVNKEIENILFPPFIYVDEPKRTLNKNKNFDIYNYYSYCKESPTFILLGE